MSFLFEEEEEEVYADEELEEAIFKDVPKKAAVQDIAEMPINERLKVATPLQQPKPVRPVPQPAPQVKEEARRFTSIDLEPKKEKVEPQPVTRHRSITADGPAPIRNDKTKNDFAFSPVISPIFGSDDEENNTTVIAAPITTGTKKKSSIGIISPIYGIDDPETPVSKSAPKRKHAAVTLEEKTNLVSEVEIDNFPDLPLEDIIKKEDDAIDDSMQISLFGEDKPIHDAVTVELKIEEE